MEWQNWVWIAGLAGLFWVMLRGCGGMARGGGCGMGGRRRDTDAHGSQAPPSEETKPGGHRAA